jgi:hypothetical protein
MGWHTIIFAFGFILGGCAVMVIMALFLLSPKKNKIINYQGFVGNPEKNLHNYPKPPELTVLIGKQC